MKRCSPRTSPAPPAESRWRPASGDHVGDRTGGHDGDQRLQRDAVRVTVIDCFHLVRKTARLRVPTIVALAVAWCGVGLYLSTDALTALQNALILMLYLLVPWTAINLVDYFLIRHGQYTIADVFSPNGMYGRWSTPGLVCYFVSIAAMTPFMVLLGSPSPHTGFLAAELGHVDYSAVVGLVVAGGLSFVLRRAASDDEAPDMTPHAGEVPVTARG